jgi:hypothetical protein
LSWPKSPLVEILWFTAGLSLLMFPAAFAVQRWPILALPYSVLVGVIMPVMTVLWAAADMRSRGQTPPFELPFLLLLCWPISLAWYCVWTRGWNGLILALGLFVLTYVPHLATMVLFAMWMVVSK